MIFPFKKAKKTPRSVILKTHEPTKCGGKKSAFLQVVPSELVAAGAF